MTLRADLARHLTQPEDEALDQILKRIEAPDNLFNLGGVFAELARIQPLIPAPLPWQDKVLPEPVIDILPALASDVLRLSASQYFAELRPPDARRTEPMLGYTKSHPVYSLLPYRCPRPQDSDRHDRLKAQVLAAAVQLRTDARCGPVIRGGTTAVRWLRDSEVMAYFPESTDATTDYRDRVHEILPKLTPGSTEEFHVSEVRRLLECAIHGYGRYAHDWIPHQRTQPVDRGDSPDDSETVERERPREQADTDVTHGLDPAKHPTKSDRSADEQQLRSSFRALVEADNDPVLPAPGFVIERPSKLSINALGEALAAGLALGELGDDVEYISQDTEAPEVPQPPQIPGTSVARQAASMKQRLVQIQRSAQMLPCAWSRLSPAEIAYGLRDMRRWLREAHSITNDGESEDAGTQEANDKLATELQAPDHEADGAAPQPFAPATIDEACAVLATMLWLSKPLEEALQLRFYALPADAEREARLIRVGYVTGMQAWVLPAIRPKQEPVYAGSDFSLAEPVSRCLFLPDHGAAWAYFQRLGSWAKARPGTPAAAITVGLGAIDAAVDEFFQRCALGTESRVTSTRWRDALFDRVVDRTGDTATAVIMLARAHRLGDTQLHYARFPVDVLVAGYQDACDGLINSMLGELAHSDPRLPPNDPRKLRGARPTPNVAKHTVAIGTRICPQVPSVRGLVDGLTALHAAATAQSSELQDLLDFHNALTTYTCWLLRFGTGYRDARTPIPLPSDLDLEGSLLMVSDKDDSTGFNSRILPLAGVVAEQLEHYRRHRQSLASRLLLRAPEFATAMIRGDQRDAKIAYDKTPASRLLRFIVLRGQRLAARPVGGKALLATMGARLNWFRLPTNCNRHYVRSRLLADGCPAEYVDCFMGHWVRGREPLSPFSSLPMRMYLDDVRTRLDRILAADGWRPVAGLA